MSKVKIVCLVLVAVLASVGTVLVIKNLGGEDIGHFDRPVQDVNVYKEVPQNVDVVQNDAVENLFIAHYKLLQHGFIGISDGYTNAMGIKQQVHNVRYVVGDFDNKQVFKEMITKGVVSSAYQLYLSGNDYIYRESDRIKGVDDVSWKQSAQPLDESDFYDDFGHRSDRLTGYILNYDTVLSGELVEQTNAALAYDGEQGDASGILYTYRYELDPVESTVYLRREMVTNGGLAEEPTFIKAVIYVTMDDEWNIKSVRTDSEYRAKTMGIFATCSENITETFTYYDGELPNTEFFEPYFGQEGEDIHKEQTALDVLMKIFEPYLGGGKALQAALSATLPDNATVNALISIDNLDIADLSRLSVSAQLGGLDVSYDNGDKAIYVKYQDFKGSTTVDGITEFVNTVTAAMGQSGSVLPDSDSINTEELLADLTYTISADGSSCRVNLPLVLGDLQINADLYADIDGETYTFTYADVSVGDIKLHIQPQSWQVPERSGAYPEILGIADIITDGRLSLDADVRLPLGGGYNVKVKLDADIANGAVRLRADLGAGNGTINAVICNNVVYAALGELKVKLDLNDADALAQLLQDYIGGSISLPQISATDVLAALGGITAAQTQNNTVTLQLPLGEITIGIDLVASDNRWNIVGLYADADSFAADIVPSQSVGQDAITVPADADTYADITSIAQTFAEPIANMLHGKGFGAQFDLDLGIFGDNYDVTGTAEIDVNGTLVLSAEIAKDGVTLIHTQIIYSQNTVYLYVNGVNVAFRIDGLSADGGSLNLQTLLQNPQIQAVLNAHPQLKQFAEQVAELARQISGVSQNTLLNSDLGALVSSFGFDNGKLHITLDGSPLGVDALQADIELFDAAGKLGVAIDGLELGGVTLSGSAELYTQVAVNIPPQTDLYILNMRGNIAGAQTELSCDFANMDIWATVQLKGGTLYARFADGTVYVRYGAIAVRLNVSDIGDIVGSVTQLLGDGAAFDLAQNIDINALLSGLNADLYSQTPNISFTYGAITVKINLKSIAAKLYFDSITLDIAADSGAIVGKLAQSDSVAEQLPVDGEFIDAKALVDQVMQTVRAFRNNSGISVDLHADVAVNGKQYNADVTLRYNGGIYVSAVLRDRTNGIAALSGSAYFVNGILYVDVNGIRQAIDLSHTDIAANASIGDLFADADIRLLIDALTQIDGIGAIINDLADVARTLPDKLVGTSLYNIVQSLTVNEQGRIFAQLNLTQLELGSVSAVIGLGSEISVGIDGIACRGIELNLQANAASACDQVTAPDISTYTNQFNIALGAGDIALQGIVELNLYNAFAAGQIQLTPNDIVAFKYADGVVYLQYGNVSAKLATADIGGLLQSLGGAVTLPQLPELGGGDVLSALAQLLGNTKFEYAPAADGYTIGIVVDNSVAITLAFDCTANSATLNGVQVNVSGDSSVDVSATLTQGNAYAQVDLTRQFVDVKQLADIFAAPIGNLAKAQGYNLQADITLDLGGKVYTVNNLRLQIVGGNVKAHFELALDNVPMLTGDLCLANGVLYLEAGDIKLAVSVNNADGNQQQNAAFNAAQLRQTLLQLTGYNDYLDGVINAVVAIVDKLPDEWNLQTVLGALDLPTLVSALTLDNGTLALRLNGGNWGLSDITLNATATNDAVSFNADGITLGGVTLSITNGSVSASDDVITAPTGDYTTNLKIKVDENNVIDVNIDALSGTVKLHLGNLDAMYTSADKTIKINYKNQLYVQGNIDEIAQRITTASDLVSEFAGMDPDAVKDVTSLLGNLDLKSILRTLTVNAADGQVNVQLTLSDITVTAKFADGALSVVEIPLSALKRTFEITACATAAQYAEYPDNVEYVKIEQVFDDYFPTIESLVKTNSWRFDFTQDSVIGIDAANMYRVNSGSYVVFYYNKSQPDDFKLRAVLDLSKQNSAGYWQPFAYVDVVIADGRVYATYDSQTAPQNTALRLTVSVDALSECIALKDDLVKVIPQIGALLDSLVNAKNDFDENKNLSKDYSTILQDISYNSAEKIFGLKLDGSVLMSDLGVIELSVQDTGDALRLNSLTLTYGDVSVNLNGIQVSASPFEDTADGRRFTYVDEVIMAYFADNAANAATVGEPSSDVAFNAGNVYGYNLNNHMNMDSLYGLLSALAVTAGNYDADGQRSFMISGTINAHLQLLLIPKDVTIDVTLYADIDAQGNSYFALKLVRSRDSLVYADLGGNSYLTFDSASGMITLARDSIIEVTRTRTWTENETYWFCTKCNAEKTLGLCLKLGHGTKYMQQLTREVQKSQNYTEEVLESDEYGNPGYKTEPITAADFMANLITGKGYLFELINFTDTIKNIISGSIDSGSGNSAQFGIDYGVDDILDSGDSYVYTANADGSGVFGVKAKLSPVSSALGELNISITHTPEYKLTAINGDLNILGKLITLTLNLQHVTPGYGNAFNYSQTHNYKW